MVLAAIAGRSVQDNHEPIPDACIEEIESMTPQRSFLASEKPLQILAAILVLMIIAGALQSASFYVDNMQGASWLVGP